MQTLPEQSGVGVGRMREPWKTILEAVGVVQMREKGFLDW
jgi:hypothetical protein